MSATDLKTLLKRVVELVMPDLRAYYRVPRKGIVVATYASDGHYWADVRPLRNDDSVDESEPMIPKVEIPVLWGGPERGVVCPPMPGTLCDITYYDGDPNYPRISNFRWAGNKAPACEVGAFVIQADPETYIKIDAVRKILQITPGDIETRAGGDSTTEIGGDKSETIGGVWTIKAPLIIQEGNVQATGADGAVGTVSCKAHTTQEGSFDLVGPMIVDSLIVRGDAQIGGNCDAATRSGGTI
ncbi:MAG: baseplate assembly protein [Proteobacteria bacterium]|nr:baseplate assembly protein [Pseudomonadota bacterium]